MYQKYIKKIKSPHPESLSGWGLLRYEEQISIRSFWISFSLGMLILFSVNTEELTLSYSCRMLQFVLYLMGNPCKLLI